MSEILKLSVVELAARLRAGSLSPSQAVDAYVDAIEARNPRLNAVVERRFEAARAEAKAAEARQARGEDLPPLFGVPCTIKEAVAVAGMLSTSGSHYFRTARAEKDATAVERLRAAGAIPLATTNVPEGCFWWETYNVVFGRTNNPYDPRRTVGGSSGGEGALIGAGASPFGIGSDVGGSIRTPSSFCGIFGHKPSQGMVPFTGHWPFYDGKNYVTRRDAFQYATIGPMARHAKDLVPVLRALKGPDGFDAVTEDIPLDDPEKVSFKNRPVFVMADPDYARAARADLEVRDAVERAAAHLVTRGARLEPIDKKLFRRAFLIWSAMLFAVEGVKMNEIVGGGKAPSVAVEVLRFLSGNARHSLPMLTYLAGENLFKLVRNKAELVEEGKRLEQTLTALLGKDGILVVPPHPRAAPKHYHPLLRPFDFTYAAIFNVLRFPATVAPMGLGKDGLPLSVQIVAAHGRDHLTLAAAQAFEEAFGGWVPPKA